MKKIKKVFTSFTLMMAGTISKVFAAIEPKYGVGTPDWDRYETKYGIFEPTMGEKISRIGKLAIPIILFVIGLFVILSKKLTTKVKAIVISTLIILAILGYVLMNYISTNL